MKKILAFLLITSQISLGQVNLNLGLRAYYPFSGNANDASGNGNNPVFNNATLTTDRLGNPNSAYHFNGTNSYIQIPNSGSLNTNNQISLCAWVRPMGFYQGPCHGNSVVMKGDVDGAAGNYLLRFDDALYTNGANCSNPVPDIVHQNFYGSGAVLPGGYTPYVQPNQWYSVILTYDGTTAKLYVDCQLKITNNYPGLTYTNAYDLFLGKLNNPNFPYWFNGDIDEVRIYDRVLTVDEVNVLGGCAPLNSIINDYTPVTAFNICENKITVEDATRFNTGDTVVMMQMKGAIIDSSNTASFGTITDYKNTGNYEFNYVKSKSGNIIELKNKLTRQYDIPTGKVQLIRVPYYNSYNVTSTLTCLPWDGSKGGVLVLNVRDTIVLNNPINVNGLGFRAGVNINTQENTLACNQVNYFDDGSSTQNGKKGEGIAFIGSNKENARGNPANGGGGGNGHNAGGGGGSNASAGGFGGYQLNNCGGGPLDNRGIGGTGLTYNNNLNKVFMGGGGGAGHYDGAPGSPHMSNGGNGGGIIIINANYLKSNGFSINALGNPGEDCIQMGYTCTHDGNGGGGGGGVILMNVTNYLDSSRENTVGGLGSNLEVYTSIAGKVGPGGGGSGGVTWFKSASAPLNGIVNNAGGLNGVIVGDGNNPWGTTPGLAGTNLFSLLIPVDNVLFKKNIDSVRIKDSSTSCRGFDFNGLGYTNTNPVSAWQWFFGDGTNSTLQNPSHLYPAEGTYNVKLIITDNIGCKDSINRNITTVPLITDADNDTTICTGTTTTLHASPATTYSWTPAAFLNNPNIQNPVASPLVTTRFYLTVTNSLGCSASDSVLVTVSSSILPSLTINTSPTTICNGKPATFIAVVTNGGSSPAFQWMKNSTNVGTNSNTYTDNNLNDGDTIKCKLTSSISCASPTTVVSNFIVMTVSSPPANIRYPDISTLANHPLQLLARTLTGSNYQWVPATGLNNNLIINPLYTYSQTTEYKIFINTPIGCQVVDTQLVKISGLKGIYVPRGFSPNGDGTNDRLYPILVGISQLNYFKVYNRWGNLLFETTSGIPANGWDGKFHGALQPVETYTWIAEGIDIDGILIKKSGNTFLIR